jgi:hypothetical protein
MGNFYNIMIMKLCLWAKRFCLESSDLNIHNITIPVD